MNKEYILKKARPYLNKKNEISSEEFNEAFGMLTLREQYQVIDILNENDVEYVDEKDPEAKETTIVQPIVSMKPKEINIKNELLCVMYQQGNTYALDMLLIKNHGFVFKVVLKTQKIYQHKLEIEDLVQEGKLGLIKAAQKFDVEMGFSFLTYAEDWIRQRVTRCIINEGYTIRFPVHMFNRINKISNLERHCLSEHIEDRIAYLSHETGLTRSMILDCLRLREQLLSTTTLNQYVGEDEDSELLAFIPDEQNSVDEIVMHRLLADEIKLALKTLTPREEKIINMRFGLVNDRTYTLEEIGKLFNVTRERIRQIEAKGLRKLRHPSRSKRVKDFLL